METSYLLINYYIYIFVTVCLTLYVAHVLFKQGRIFMLDIFRGRVEIADATNNLFKVGFYLLNLGFALMYMNIGYDIINTRELLETLTYRLGWFSIYLGVMLFLNLYLFFRGKRKSAQNQAVN